MTVRANETRLQKSTDPGQTDAVHIIVCVTLCYFVTLSHCHIITLFTLLLLLFWPRPDWRSTYHSVLPCLLLCYRVTLLHCHIITLLHCYIATLLLFRPDWHSTYHSSVLDSALLVYSYNIIPNCIQWLPDWHSAYHCAGFCVGQYFTFGRNTHQSVSNAMCVSDNMQCNATQCNTTQWNAMQCNATKWNAVQSNAG